MEIKTIGIAGFGVLGKSLFNYFETNLDYKLTVYDPPLKMGSKEELNKADVVFICTPTPYNQPTKKTTAKQTGFDLSYVRDVIKALEEEKTVVVKSTIIPGSTDALQKEFPQHKLFYCPEFLTETSAGYDMAHPNRQILGMSEKVEADFSANEDMKILVESVFRLLPYSNFRVYVSAKVAEMTKYFGNAFYATKVTFANQMYDLCDKLGVNYKAVKQCVVQEPMIGKNHLDIFHHGYRGYSGKCLPKDTRSLIDLGDELGVSLDLLKAAEKINNKLIK